MGAGYEWNDWHIPTFDDLAKLDDSIKALEDETSEIHDSLIELKLKTKILWSVIGALIGTLVTLITMLFTGVL